MPKTSSVPPAKSPAPIPKTARPSVTAAYVLLLCALALGGYFLRNFLGLVALAAVTATLFMPVRRWFVRRGRMAARMATGLTLITAMLSLVIPVVVLAAASIYQTQHALADLKSSHFLEADRFQDLLDRGIETANKTAHRLPFGDRANLSKDKVLADLRAAGARLAGGAANTAIQSSSNIVGVFTGAIIYLMLLASMLSRGDRIIRLVKRMSPLDDSINDEYLRKMGAMAVSMVKGTFVIALVAGLLSAGSLWIAGVPYPLFWFVLVTLLSLVPLGGGVILLPIGIGLVLFGHTPQGVLVLAVQFIIINNLDNILRPRLAGKESAMPAALLLLGAFAGVGFFGILGVIYGPIIMVLITTTISIYDRYAETGIPLKAAGIA